MPSPRKKSKVTTGKGVKVTRDPKQGRISEDGAVRKKLPVDDLDPNGVMFFTVGATRPPWYGVDMTAFLTPAEQLTALTPQGGTFVPVFGMQRNCYQCLRVPVLDRLWDICNNCRRELLNARRGLPRSEWSRDGLVERGYNPLRAVLVPVDFAANRKYESTWIGRSAAVPGVTVPIVMDET